MTHFNFLLNHDNELPQALVRTLSKLQWELGNDSDYIDLITYSQYEEATAEGMGDSQNFVLRAAFNTEDKILSFVLGEDHGGGVINEELFVFDVNTDPIKQFKVFLSTIEGTRLSYTVNEYPNAFQDIIDKHQALCKILSSPTQ